MRRRQPGRRNTPEWWNRARLRVGLTPEARSRWLLTFAARDLDALPASSWKGLLQDLAVFLSTPPAHHRRFTVDPSWGVGEPGARDCHAWINEVLTQLQAPSRTRRLEVDLERRRIRLIWQEGSFFPIDAVTALGAMKEVVLLETLRMLGRRLRFCPREGCGRGFVARKRQVYCSPRCSQTVRSRRWRDANPEEARAARRASYRRKLPKNIKIATRRPARQEPSNGKE
jgi:hypothetical protein